MAYTLGPFEQRQYFDANGNPLAGGKIYTYLTGTVTPATTYNNSTGTPNANPIVLDSQGRTRIYLDPLVAYKFVLVDSLGVSVGLDMDPVSLNLANANSNTFQGATRGTVGAPVFTFAGDTDTGIYSSAANTLDVATSGVNRLRFLPGGGLGAPDGTVSAPTYGFTSDPNTGIYWTTADQIAFATGGVKSFQISGSPTGATFLSAGNGLYGTGAVTGNQLQLGNNASGNGAAAVINLNGKGSAFNYIWADASAAPGMLRISTAPPEEDGTPSDTSGTVVGTQASWHDRKIGITPTAVTPAAALAAVLDATIYDFAYKGDSYQDADGHRATFTGFVGYDRTDWFLMNVGPQQDPALNEITIPGYYALAFKALKQEIDDLRAEIAALKAGA